MKMDKLINAADSSPKDMCPNVDGLQRAVVAMSCVHNNAIIVSASCGIKFDFEEGGVDAGDVWRLSELESAFLDNEKGREGGLRVWEGRIATSQTSWEHPGDFDVDYDGRWRTLTDDELRAVADGRDPFRCSKCDGSAHVLIARRQKGERP